MPVQVHGCGALRNLACGTRDDPHSRARALKAIEKANGVDVVINAIRTHPDNLMLSAQACAALRNISMTPELRGSVVARGGVEVAASVLQATLDLTHSAACEQAVACLANLVNSLLGDLERRVSLPIVSTFKMHIVRLPTLSMQAP